MTATLSSPVSAKSVDGTSISQADLARIEAEEALHEQQQRSAARVVAASATDVEDCRMMFSILGLGPEIVAAARAEIAAEPASKRARKRRVAA